MPQVVSRQRFLTESLLVVTTGLILGILGMRWLGSAWYDAAGVLTGLLYVHWAAREKIACFAIGVISALFTGYSFFQQRLFGDAGLQGVYCLFMVLGWWQWSKGTDSSPMIVRHWTLKEILAGAAFVGVGTSAGYVLFQQVAGKMPFWDALTTSLSLLAQWFTTRKVIENWPLWIVVNAVYIPVYIRSGLAIYTALYAVFLVMAIFGWLEWLRSAKRSPLAR